MNGMQIFVQIVFWRKMQGSYQLVTDRAVLHDGLLVSKENEGNLQYIGFRKFPKTQKPKINNMSNITGLQVWVHLIMPFCASSIRVIILSFVCVMWLEDQDE